MSLNLCLWYWFNPGRQEIPNIIEKLFTGMESNCATWTAFCEIPITIGSYNFNSNYKQYRFDFLLQLPSYMYIHYQSQHVGIKSLFGHVFNFNLYYKQLSFGFPRMHSYNHYMYLLLWEYIIGYARN